MIFCTDWHICQSYSERRKVMTKKPKNHGKSWTSQDEQLLKKLAKENTPTRVIGLKLGRTEDSVRTKAKDIDISLKPTNQSPYNRRRQS